MLRDAEAGAMRVRFESAWRAGLHRMPKALAKYRNEAKVVAKVTMSTLDVGLVRRDRASFFKQFAHSKSAHSTYGCGVYMPK